MLKQVVYTCLLNFYIFNMIDLSYQVHGMQALLNPRQYQSDTSILVLNVTEGVMCFNLTSCMADECSDNFYNNHDTTQYNTTQHNTTQNNTTQNNTTQNNTTQHNTIWYCVIVRLRVVLKRTVVGD